MLVVVFTLSLLLLAKAREKDATCPPPRDIEPCTCEVFTPKEKEVWMTCSYIPSLEELTLIVKGMKGYEIDKFVLEHSDIGYIPSNLFLHTTIREIIIKSMVLDNIGSDGEVVFQGQEASLQSIAIRRCRMDPKAGIDWSKIDNLHALESMELSKNDLSLFPADWFRFRSTSLRFVYLTEDEIEKLEEDAFSSLTRLVMLDLSENKISRLSRSMFPMPAEMLTYFDVNDNQISTLPRDMFNSMASLKRVNFANNLLQTIDGSVWKAKFSLLTHLDLLGNRIRCDCKLLWTVDTLKPNFYFGECTNATDGETKKLSKISALDLYFVSGC